VESDYVIAHVHLILHPVRPAWALADTFCIAGRRIAESVAHPVPEHPAKGML
jgi:hypothetical protein